MDQYRWLPYTGSDNDFIFAQFLNIHISNWFAISKIWCTCAISTFRIQFNSLLAISRRRNRKRFIANPSYWNCLTCCSSLVIHLDALIKSNKTIDIVSYIVYDRIKRENHPNLRQIENWTWFLEDLRHCMHTMN